MYTSENKGVLPGQAFATPEQSSDWVAWRTYQIAGITPPAGTLKTAFRPEISTTGIGPFLHLSPTNVSVLRCPADPNAADRQNLSTGYYYPFSYQLNWAMGCTPYVSIDVPTATYKGPFHRSKLSQVKSSSEKVLIMETDERYVIDGQTAVSQPMGTPASYCNLLADRHDAVNRAKADWKPDGTHGDVIINSAGKGNAAFCDGHAEYVPRSYVHTRQHSMPDPRTDYPSFTEPTMK
jgi:prepilin-type processing-associated H-X9-DG protein